MNLIDSPWLPFRLRNGTSAYRPPSAAADPEVIDLGMPRVDFQGAAWQWLIGLLQTAYAPDDYDDWLDAYFEPPSSDDLKQHFGCARHAFDLFGDGPCFMQEYALPDNARESSVASLLIEAPGAQTTKFNADHFIKRGVGAVMAPETAAIALFAMQINAPSGGKGYRVGLRGGGPLTTLVLPHDAAASLWQKLWLNVLPRTYWSYPEPDLHDWRVFPWLAPTRVSDASGRETIPDDVHPLHMYWAMPRRFRLNVEEQACTCAVSGQDSPYRVRSVRTTNYGYNYDGAWRHPLTPYRIDPKKTDQPPLSIKGQQGGLGYRHWESLVLEEREQIGNLPALVIDDYRNKAEWLSECDAASRYVRLWAFGFDMDNMKARCWYSTQMPLLAVDTAYQERFHHWVHTLIDVAGKAAWQVRNAVKAAWFSRPGDAKGDFSMIEHRFWEATEREFYGCIHELFEQLANTQDGLLPAGIAARWRWTVAQAGRQVFDDCALTGEAEALDMKRVTAARNRLGGWLARGKEMRELQKLASEEAA